jgi:hypothetical protein
MKCRARPKSETRGPKSERNPKPEARIQNSLSGQVVCLLGVGLLLLWVGWLIALRLIAGDQEFDVLTLRDVLQVSFDGA